MLELWRRKIGEFYFVVQRTSEVIGAGLGISGFVSLEGEGVPIIERKMYFEEQTAEHIDNFCQKFAYDSEYRKRCLEGAAHWRRVGRLYELNAEILVEEHEPSELRLRELFHFIRRDLELIEQHPEYRAEIARQLKGEESGLESTLSLLAQVQELEISQGCQGSKAIQVRERTIFLPSCHSTRAMLVFSGRPDAFLRYLRSGSLGQFHLAAFGVDRIAAALPSRNPVFIEALRKATLAYLHKHGHPTAAKRPVTAKK